MKRILLPLFDYAELKIGQWVLLQGVIYTARDQAHKRLVKEGLPPYMSGQAVYYAGPSPIPPGEICGSIGPTTSRRMDPFAPQLIKQGLRCMIGKGDRSQEVVDAIKKHRGVYLVTVGGAGAYLAQKVIDIKTEMYEDLGAEAIYRLEICDFPAFVAIDSEGNSIFS